jgi:hypothetical protein
MIIAGERLRNQRLVGRPFATPPEVVAWLGAVQAQDYDGAKWALGQRLRPAAATDAAVEAAIDRGAILRTHVLRPTWHFLTAADLRWVLALSAPRVHQANSYYYRMLDLDGKTLARSQAVLLRALAGGRHRTRTELAAVLADAGIRAARERLAYILMHAELEAVVTSGRRRGKQFTYALVDERVAPSPPRSREQALAELTRRYFTSHGPALLTDYAWWSGLTMADVRAGVEMLGAALASETIEGKTFWFATPTPSAGRRPGGVVHLLPNFDELLVAYKDHTSTVDAAVAAKVRANPGSLDLHIVALDGQVVGGWKRRLRPDQATVSPRLLVRLPPEARQALAAAVERYARFLGRPVRVISTKRR